MNSFKSSRAVLAVFAFILSQSLAGCGGGSDSSPSPSSTSQSSAPTITVQPAPISIAAGQTAIFAVTATGTPPLSFQWKVDGISIAGGKEASYTVASATMANAGSYTVVVSNASGSVTSAAAALTISQALTVKDIGGYLQLGRLGLLSLDAQLAAEPALSVVQESGAAMDFKLGPDKVLRYLSPPEQFGDSSSVLRIANAGSTRVWRLTLKWASRVGPSLVRVVEADESGTVPAQDNVAIAVAGVGSDGIVGPTVNALSYRISNAPVLDASTARISLIGTGVSQDITSYFTIDATGGVLTLKPDKLLTLLTSVKSANIATISVSVSTAHFATTVGFEQTLTYGDGKLSVAVVNSDASAVTSLGGSRFVARGFNTGFTAQARLTADGKLQFNGLPADSYAVTQVLLDVGLPLTGFGTLPTSSSATLLTIKKVAATPVSANLVTAQSAVLSGPDPLQSTLPVRREPQSLLRVSPKVSSGTAAYSASVVSGPQDTLVTTPLNYAVPAGTVKISAHVEVYSAEYPVYTSQQSRFNDLWLFDVELPGLSIFSESGKVNQSHTTRGTVSIDKCVDVSSLTKDASAQLSGQLGAQNVADNLFPTTVSLSVSLSCDALSITEFGGQSRAADGQPILFPITTARSEATPDGNVAGQYLSLPISAQLPSSFGIPVTLKFDPSGATLTEIEFFLRTGSGDYSLGRSYLDQANQPQAGQVSFSSMRLMPASQSQVSERVQLVAVIRGTLPETASVAESKPYPLTINGKFSSFTPIYLASELSGYKDSNRFGTHGEPGGDSWATASMVNWMFSNGLRYNDISAANVKQTGAGRSVLGHAGHSDAQQADLRYWDGSGGFADTLGGANRAKGLQDLATIAQSEVAANAASKPNLAKLIAWVNQNRTNLGAYAAKTEVRRIYIGNAHVAELLIKGVFPGTSTGVPGLSEWAAMSAKILPQSDHLDHWHVSTSRL